MSTETLELAFKLVADEIMSAEELFPEWPIDLVHGAAIVAEESGELIRAAMHCQWDYVGGNIENVKTEAIQTAAMAIRMLYNCLERDKNES